MRARSCKTRVSPSQIVGHNIQHDIVLQVFFVIKWYYATLVIKWIDTGVLYIDRLNLVKYGTISM